VATVEGDVFFHHDLRLRVLEVVRFDLIPPRLSRYGYEVWRGSEKLYWYDSHPHPNDPSLAATPPLTTKLYIPSVWPGLVSRPRLIERLNVGGNASVCSLSCLGVSLIKILP